MDPFTYEEWSGEDEKRLNHKIKSEKESVSEKFPA